MPVQYNKWYYQKKNLIEIRISTHVILFTDFDIEVTSAMNVNHNLKALKTHIRDKWVCGMETNVHRRSPILFRYANPNQPGGCSSPPPPPLDIFRDKSAARIGLATRFHEFFPYCFAHILRPNLWRPGVWLQSYVTFSTCMSAPKIAQICDFCVQIQCKLGF